MVKKLLIVESPAKAGTIKKYLGADYKVVASMGHVIDLPKSQLGVDVEDDFEPKYITIRGKGPLLTQLKKDAAAADKVYLATDPDREGEAISWHLAHALKLPEDSVCRVTFNEITKSAVKAAMKNPRRIDMDLVNAQQARRVLDRIVGYKISPILWEKVKRGLSAGRVQSAALKLLCDREDLIENFVPEEYHTILAELICDKKQFTASYYGTASKEVKLSNAAEAKAVIDRVANTPFVVSGVKRGEQKRNPFPPFTTSTLQQDASRKINFQTGKTMQVAQTLYEGVNLGGKLGTVGLITYMRTDSLRISSEAQAEAVEYIKARYGDKYAAPRQYKTKKNSQDAHEAIRPTSVNIRPQDIKDKLTGDQFKLYKLIWERFVASQMISAVYETISVNITSGTDVFRASDSQVKVKGYMEVYVEGRDKKEEKKKKLPPLETGMRAELSDIRDEQHFTQPPTRFSEALLVKELEEKGIGRPSTYAPIISTIVARGYVVRNKKQLMPTELGMVTLDLLKNNFSDIVDIDFTAEMETKLDLVDEGQLDWKDILRDFYPDFEKDLEAAHKNIEKINIKDEESDVICDKCGRKMVYKLSKFGRFLACPGYPECKNTMAIRNSTGVKCPKCDGEILIRKSRKGKIYYACENLPKCDFMAWYEPVGDKPCPLCGGLLLRKNDKKIVCNTDGCGYEETIKKGKK